MLRIDRILELHKILANRRTPISHKILEEKLECSRSTVTRTIEISRDYLHTPIKYNHKLNGYYYDTQNHEAFELPGLWFNESEIHALLATHQLLSNVQPGLLEPHIAPLLKRINNLLDERKLGGNEIANRIKILQSAPRLTNIDEFRKITDALIKRKRINILYHGRGRDETTERIVSPQRLTYYRDNWYLDAWCHLRKGLRSFSLDRLRVIYTHKNAKDIDERKLNTHYSDAYGIFAGRAKHKAVIRFSSSAARWVADEEWHPSQECKINHDGSCELIIPYSDPRELIMDIMKYGSDAKVIKPASLRQLVTEKTRQAAEKYN